MTIWMLPSLWLRWLCPVWPGLTPVQALPVVYALAFIIASGLCRLCAGGGELAVGLRV